MDAKRSLDCLLRRDSGTAASARGRADAGEQLNIAPTFHSDAMRSGLRLSPSNFVYNHIGHFAAANYTACKAMFLGGVTRRFSRP